MPLSWWDFIKGVFYQETPLCIQYEIFIAWTFVIIIQFCMPGIFKSCNKYGCAGTPQVVQQVWCWMLAMEWHMQCRCTRALPCPTASCGWMWLAETCPATCACCCAKRAWTSTPLPSLRSSGRLRRSGSTHDEVMHCTCLTLGVEHARPRLCIDFELHLSDESCMSVFE